MKRLIYFVFSDIMRENSIFYNKDAANTRFFS